MERPGALVASMVSGPVEAVPMSYLFDYEDIEGAVDSSGVRHYHSL
jgi:hypothetical protein